MLYTCKSSGSLNLSKVMREPHAQPLPIETFLGLKIRPSAYQNVYSRCFPKVNSNPCHQHEWGTESLYRQARSVHT